VSVADEVLAVYAARGAGAYFGERVSITQHCLQAAWFARVEGAPEPLVIAGLLHDVGHLLEAVPDDLAEWTSDAHHEETGARWLAERFGPAISEPVRLHVPAKRYLCATDAGYFRLLSSASVHTLKLQGGPMSPDETRAFEREPYWREAVRVRHWDDHGKVAGLEVPPLEAYLSLLNSAARAR
jgi:phosphonate degradation associated HDIG domain protein